MATHTVSSSYQSLQVSEIALEEGENAIVNLGETRSASVRWDDGGVSWTINPTTAGESISVKIEHSLTASGDDGKYWVDDLDSPTTASLDGNEHYRVQRIRFTATTGDITVIVASNSRFEVSF